MVAVCGYAGCRKTSVACSVALPSNRNDPHQHQHKQERRFVLSTTGAGLHFLPITSLAMAAARHGVSLGAAGGTSSSTLIQVVDQLGGWGQSSLLHDLSSLLPIWVAHRCVVSWHVPSSHLHVGTVSMMSVSSLLRPLYLLCKSAAMINASVKGVTTPPQRHLVLTVVFHDDDDGCCSSQSISYLRDNNSATTALLQEVREKLFSSISHRDDENTMKLAIQRYFSRITIQPLWSTSTNSNSDKSRNSVEFDAAESMNRDHVVHLLLTAGALLDSHSTVASLVDLYSDASLRDGTLHTFPLVNQLRAQYDVKALLQSEVFVHARGKFLVHDALNLLQGTMHGIVDQLLAEVHNDGNTNDNKEGRNSIRVREDGPSKSQLLEKFLKQLDEAKIPIEKLLVDSISSSTMSTSSSSMMSLLVGEKILESFRSTAATVMEGSQREFVEKVRQERLVQRKREVCEKVGCCVRSLEQSY